MEHLDEGMAHAWIDGELSADETVAIEAHLQTCGSCAAIVAEARGFVAATSRIVSQLDHVSAGVIPAVATTRPAALRARRGWWRHPAFAVAAVLGVTTMGWLSLRGTSGGIVPTSASEHAPAGDITTVASTPAGTSAPAGASASTVAPAAKLAKARARETRVSADADAGAAVRSEALRIAVRAEGEPSRTIAPAPTSPSPTAPIQSAPRQLDDRSVSTANRVGASGLTAEKASFAAGARGVIDSVALRRADAAGVTPLAAQARTRASLAGCYVLARADNTERPATMQLPPRIRLTDSVRATSSTAATFLAYGMRDGAAAEVPLQYRRVGAMAFELSPAFDDAALGEASFVRVLVVAGNGQRPNSPPADAEFVARRQACP